MTALIHVDEKKKHYNNIQDKKQFELNSIDVMISYILYMKKTWASHQDSVAMLE